MTAGTVQINLRVNYPMILIASVILHVLLMAVHGFNGESFISDVSQNVRRPLQVQSIRPLTKKDIQQLEKIRTVGAKDSTVKNSTYLQKTNSDTRQVTKQKFSDNPGNAFKPTESKSQRQHPLSLSDLSMSQQAVKNIKPQKVAEPQKMARPGTRPEMAETRPRALEAISLRGSEMKQFLRQSESSGGAYAAGGMSAASISGDPRAASLNNSDVMVNLEVPEGVDPDELNKYELMFYGFQRRTALNYVNTFYKRLDKFNVENPHLQFPMTETKQVMTGRITYDSAGNIKQIKMIRWSNIDKLQDFFENVLKDMDTLHNPPQALWKDTGEFSIFFSLVING